MVVVVLVVITGSALPISVMVVVELQLAPTLLVVAVVLDIHSVVLMVATQVEPAVTHFMEAAAVAAVSIVVAQVLSQTLELLLLELWARVVILTIVHLAAPQVAAVVDTMVVAVQPVPIAVQVKVVVVLHGPVRWLPLHSSQV